MSVPKNAAVKKARPLKRVLKKFRKVLLAIRPQNSQEASPTNRITPKVTQLDAIVKPDPSAKPSETSENASSVMPTPFQQAIGQAIVDINKPGQSGTPPSRINLLDLPREMRDIIYEFAFQKNGVDYAYAQLRGHPDLIPLSFSHQLKCLSVCKQFYEEAFPIAYGSTCFYYFQSHGYTSIDTHVARLTDHQVDSIRHIAFWSNPYLPETIVDKIGTRLNLHRLTVCSNYMSGTPQFEFLQKRVTWLFEIVKELKTIKTLELLSGCAITPGQKNSDCDFATSLRQVIISGNPSDEKITVGPFEAYSLSFPLTIAGEEGKPARKVEMVVCSIFELDKQMEQVKSATAVEEIGEKN